MNTTFTNSVINNIAWESQTQSIFVISIHLVNFLLGLPLNTYIVILLFPRHGMIDGSDVFSLNQAVVEMLFVLLGPFHSLCSISLKLCLFKTLGFFLGITMFSRCLFQCSVCLERYLAVVHPVTFLRYRPPRYRVAWSIMNWMWALAVGLICALTFPNMPYNIFSAVYVLILIVDAFCCMSILRKLRHSGPRDRENEEVKIGAAKRKAFQVVSVNLLLFLMQNIPIAITFGLYIKLSLQDFALAVLGSLAVNTVTGLLQPVSVLHKVGRLSAVWSLMKGTPFHTTCFSSRSKKATTNR